MQSYKAASLLASHHSGFKLLNEVNMSLKSGGNGDVNISSSPVQGWTNLNRNCNVPLRMVVQAPDASMCKTGSFR